MIKNIDYYLSIIILLYMNNINIKFYDYIF